MGGAYETVGLGSLFEDLPIGRKFSTVGRTITETDIVLFVNTVGMTEVLFTNYEFLKHESDIKGRVSLGALVFCIAEGLLTPIQGTGLAFLRMTLDIKGPTLAGDTIHVECEVIKSRLSNSRPGRGLVRTHNRVVKQDGTVVMEYTPLRMVKCRNVPAKSRDRIALHERRQAASWPVRRTPCGLRSADLAVKVLGPVATRFVGDMGPDAMKMERPAEIRTARPGRGRRHRGMSPIHLNVNRNVCSATLDFRSETLLRLVE